MRLPDFIIIGAAKAGTTAMYWHLAEHPEVFMSEVKETNFFAFEAGPDGAPTYGDPALHRFPVRSWQAYCNLFENAGAAIAVGEASPMYLECPSSAERIRAAVPHARIICGLRNPVDRAYSDYLMYLRSQGRAFDAARDLREDAEWAQPDSHWMRVSRYHANLKRYFDRFPRERIHVFLTEDFRRDAVGVVQSLYRFVGVDPGFTPDLDTPYNVGGVPSSPFVERLFTAGASVRLAIEPWLPASTLKWLRRVRAGNMQKPPALPEALRRRLTEHFEDDIERTASLTGLDLAHWLEPKPVFPLPMAGTAPAERRAM